MQLRILANLLRQLRCSERNIIGLHQIVRLLLRLADNPFIFRFCVSQNAVAFIANPLRLLYIIRKGEPNFSDNIKNIFRFQHNLACQWYIRRVVYNIFQLFEQFEDFHRIFHFYFVFPFIISKTYGGTSIRPSPPREITCFAMVELIKAYFASDIKNTVSTFS